MTYSAGKALNNSAVQAALSCPRKFILAYRDEIARPSSYGKHTAGSIVHEVLAQNWVYSSVEDILDLVSEKTAEFLNDDAAKYISLAYSWYEAEEQVMSLGRKRGIVYKAPSWTNEFKSRYGSLITKKDMASVSGLPAEFDWMNCLSTVIKCLNNWMAIRPLPDTPVLIEYRMEEDLPELGGRFYGTADRIEAGHIMADLKTDAAGYSKENLINMDQLFLYSLLYEKETGIAIDQFVIYNLALGTRTVLNEEEIAKGKRVFIPRFLRKAEYARYLQTTTDPVPSIAGTKGYFTCPCSYSPFCPDYIIMEA